MDSEQTPSNTDGDAVSGIRFNLSDQNVRGAQINVAIAHSFMAHKSPKYWIYVVIHELYENLDSLTPFITLLENFGLSTENEVELVLPFRTKYASTRQEVLSLKWDTT